MRWKFDPRPDARTPTRSRERSGIADSSRAGLDLTHLEHRLARSLQEGAGAVGVWTKADSVTDFDGFASGNER